MHSVSRGGSNWFWQGGLCHRVMRHFCLYECQRHFRKYFESSVLAQRERTSKCVFRNDSRDLLCSPKALQGAGKRVFHVFVIFLLVSLSLHNGVHKVEEERERSKGDPRVRTRVVICVNWSLQ